MLQVDIGLRAGRFALDAAFAAEAGVTAIFGRSGSGKSTILNAIAGLLRPERGRIVADGEILFDAAARVFVPPERRGIGYVFQDARLFPHMSVRQNLAYGQWRTRRGRRPIDFEQVIDLMGLGHLVERRPGALSGGEKQRVAIGRALLSHPRLILMDEPLASLDMLRKAEILQYIERLRDELGIPIVYVSHAIDEVTRLAGTLVLMADGGVVAAGPLAQVLNRPELSDYAGRTEVGAVIEARVREQDIAYDLATLEFPGGVLKVANLDALPGDTVRVRVPAREVALATSAPADTSVLNVLRGTIESLHADGGAAVDVRLRVGETLIVARITRYSADRLALAPGRAVYAMVKSVSLDRQASGYA